MGCVHTIPYVDTKVTFGSSMRRTICPVPPGEGSTRTNRCHWDGTKPLPEMVRRVGISIEPYPTLPSDVTTPDSSAGAGRRTERSWLLVVSVPIRRLNCRTEHASDGTTSGARHVSSVPDDTFAIDSFPSSNTQTTTEDPPPAAALCWYAGNASPVTVTTVPPDESTVLGTTSCTPK